MEKHLTLSKKQLAILTLVFLMLWGCKKEMISESEKATKNNTSKEIKPSSKTTIRLSPILPRIMGYDFNLNYLGHPLEGC